MADVQVVVARYAENVAWVDDLGYPAVIYDKSEAPLPGAIPLPNIGREAHTYITHIVRTYDTLPETTVFLQGDPFFHLRQDGGGTVADLRAMIDEGAGRGVPFKGFAWFRVKCDGLGRPHQMNDPASKGKWKGWGKDIPVAAMFERLFAASAPAEFIARGMTGNFMVARNRVLARPLSFYETCLRLIEDDPYDEMNTGHGFERLWHLIFNGNEAWNSLSGNGS